MSILNSVIKYFSIDLDLGVLGCIGYLFAVFIGILGANVLENNALWVASLIIFFFAKTGIIGVLLITLAKLIIFPFYLCYIFLGWAYTITEKNINDE